MNINIDELNRTADADVKLQHYRIDVQPQSYFRFRSLGDLTSKHGTLQGENFRDAPSVIMEVGATLATNDFYVLCSLHEIVERRPDVAGVILSPYSLFGRRQQKNFVFDKMTTSTAEKGVFRYQLKNHAICTINKMKDWKKVWTEHLFEKYKQQMLRMERREVLTDAETQEIRTKIDLQLRIYENVKVEEMKLRLGFTIFMSGKLDKQYHYCIGPIYSNPITNCKSLGLPIHKLCNKFVSVDGNDEVTFLISEFNKSEMRIFLRESDDKQMERVYIDDAKIEVFKNFAVTFKAPKFWRQEDKLSEIPCNMYVERGSQTTFPVMLIYKNNRKRQKLMPSTVSSSAATKRPSENTDAIKCNAPTDDISQEVDILEVAIRKLTKLFRNCSGNPSAEQDLATEMAALNNDYVKSMGGGSTIMHDAIQSGDFLKIAKITNTPATRAYISQAVDHNRNNLLHTACALNKSDYIRGLIGVGCRLSAKNTVDSTPLHIAIEERHSDCIDKFVEIISDISLFPGLADDLVRLFTVYNRHGYTVLHLAVLNGCEPLVRALLEFARSHNIAACAIQELTNGKTIAHLAMMKGNLALARLFATYDPMACYYKNYERLNCYDMYTQLSTDHPDEEAQLADALSRTTL